MGILSSSSSSPPSSKSGIDSPTPSPDGAFIAPSRQSRAVCYAARDRFFECLEKNGIIDSIKEKEKSEERCGMEEGELRRECVGSWVTYFKQRRVMEHNKKQTIEKLEKEGASVL
ncbi:hypothetical protein JMJ35_000369 [Cladonia borealis]|uniref:Uncharacterized protein n=1 Tax=Cladonia borealis TaxID=184061 RepID=A0AA39V7W1_9LECA|nr:hypothetical protein JMJ35_000369 [Cladonia borealis]